MVTCPKCHADVPEQMRFCLQCGASLAPEAPPASADLLTPAAPPAPPARHAGPTPPGPESAPPRKLTPTVPLKIAPTPVMAPRSEAPAESASHLGDQMVEVDDETLKKSFERPVTQAGAVLCRFCKGPLDIDGDFCEQCGAPVSEAAPPGMVKPKPKPAAPPAAPAPLPSKPAQAAPPVRPPVGSAPARQPSAAPPLPAKLVARPTPARTPVPPPLSPPTLPAEEPPSGLMGRLKGLFKKG